MNDLEQVQLDQHATLRQALDRLNSSGPALTLFVVDGNGELVGSLTDGDVRRGLLEGVGTDAPVTQVMNTTPRSVDIDQFGPGLYADATKLGIRALPLLNEKSVMIDVIDLTAKQDRLPLHAVIMAGGKGTRLRPFTDNKPKPLVPVGGRPIIEYSLELLAKHGIEHVTLAVNHMKEMILEHVGDGQRFDLNIDHVQEDEPKGTAGALSLLENVEHEHLLVMNSDLLTTIDLSTMMDLHLHTKAAMTVATTGYQVSIPYAVLDCDGQQVQRFQEKPTYSFPCNAGIYIIDRSLLSRIPERGTYHATDLLERLIEDELPVAAHEIKGYWLDIGQHADLEKADRDVKTLPLINLTDA